MVKRITIPLASEKRSDGSYSITSPLVPMFHAVGEDEPTALNNAVEILKGHLERNYPFKVQALRLADDPRDIFPDAPPTTPAHVIAEITA